VLFFGNTFNKYRLLLIIFCISSCALSSSSFGQKRYVLAVAAQTKRGGLRFIDSDIKMIAQVLGTSDAIVKLLSSEDERYEFPTEAKFLEELNNICSKAKPEDSVWIYISSHGMKKDGQSCVVLPNTRTDDMITLLPLSRIRKSLISSCKAKMKYLVSDSCHSGSLKSLPVAKLENTFEKVDGVVTIASSSEDEASAELPEFRHGLFSFFFARGLSGGDSSSKLVNLATLKEYVTKNVVKISASKGITQTPVFIVTDKDLNSSYLGNFVAVTPPTIPGNPLGNASSQNSGASAIGDVSLAVVQSTSLDPVFGMRMEGVEDKILESSIFNSFLTDLLSENIVAIDFRSQLDGASNEENLALAVGRLNASYLIRVNFSVSSNSVGIGDENYYSARCMYSIRIIDTFGRVVSAIRSGDNEFPSIKRTGLFEKEVFELCIRECVSILSKKLPKVIKGIKRI
jgi:hypothetical protein